ncbi:uncharacterized protein LOC111263803 [Varroa jacobsoni]|uniref:Uncharacterized protein n=1 Tax=Varroa destructor TaxID=109461 RepID=A0A7M7J779_VARDE|nr:uncharacterized protein LOC111244600 [Varroa destructor]XP_022694934.1 uncharacterized protein LOC111263803 [Varroa jacobsoni]
MSSTTEQSNQSPGETHALTPSPPRDSGGRPSNDGLGSSEEDSDHEFEGYDLNRWIVLHAAILIPVIITVCFFVIDTILKQDQRKYIEGTMEKHLYNMVCMAPSFRESALCLRLGEILGGSPSKSIMMDHPSYNVPSGH